MSPREFLQAVLNCIPRRGLGYFKMVLIGREDECWRWTGNVNNKGYGVLYIHPKNKGAHVIALEASSKEDAAGRQALHSCDKPACCNPSHLRWGSAKDNMNDKKIRGRYRGCAGEGTKNHSAVLNEDQVRKIRNESGTLSEIGRRFGVCPQTINLIKLGKIWKSVC